jgi:beta-glucosidase
LYGAVSPGRTPFSWGANRESYGVDVLYTPNNGKGAPQQDFSEGNFIDYRHFDKANSSLIYEFGYGLSYTTFEYSNIKVEKSNASAYQPTIGERPAAPTFGNFSRNPGDYVFPADEFPPVYSYVYPYLNTTDLKKASTDRNFGKNATEFLPPNANDGSQQPLLRSSGKSSPGGNAQLYDVLYTVTAEIKNTGSVAGDEIPQLYVSLGGPTDPRIVLRGFDRIRIDPGQTTKFKATLTRRDLSNWDTTIQDWVTSSYPKTVYVGRSSRKLDLSAPLA